MAKKPYRPKDFFFHKAKEEGFRARSAFKIEEIAGRFAVFKKGGHVLDLGAAPGGFLQVIADAVGPKGSVIGVDVVDRPVHVDEAAREQGAEQGRSMVGRGGEQCLDMGILGAAQIRPGTGDVEIAGVNVAAVR